MSTNALTGARGAREGLWVLTAAYLSFGYFWGTWVVAFSDLLRAHALTPGEASLRLVALSISSIAVMTLAAPRLEPAPRRLIISGALGFHALGSVLIAVAPTGFLAVAFGITGIGTGLIDVFVNAAGQDLESRSGRSILQWVHASYSLGGALGALVSALALTAGASVTGVLVAAGVVQAGAGVAALPSSTLGRGSARDADSPRVSLAIFRRNRWLLVPAGVVLAAFFVEGSMDVWSVIYLRRTLGASTLAGGAGFAAFSIALTVGRAFAARILFGMGHRRTILFSGIGSMIAGIVAVAASSPRVASISFLVLGFCLASAAPAAFGMAGRWGRDAGLAIAAMTTVGYTGFVVGPPLMGWLADEFGLRASMLALMVCTVGIAAGAMSRWPAAESKTLAPREVVEGRSGRA